MKKHPLKQIANHGLNKNIDASTINTDYTNF